MRLRQWYLPPFPSPAHSQVLRDLILSFTLPRKIVGVRRAPLLSREANREATEQYPLVLQEAHECAMRGAEWSWQRDENCVHKICALLAGLCITFAGRAGGADIIRKQDAFRGRVQLPFIETQPCPESTQKIVWIPHTNEWCVYRVRHGCASVQLRSTGLEGLSQSVLLVTSNS